MIEVTVKDGYNGATRKLSVKIIDDKIYLTNNKDVFYWSGALVNYEWHGTNQIVLPLRRLVESIDKV